MNYKRFGVDCFIIQTIVIHSLISFRMVVDMLQITAEQALRLPFCCLKASLQFAQSKLVYGTLCKTENCWARSELGSSKERENTEQAQPEQGHRKGALVAEPQSSRIM